MKTAKEIRDAQLNFGENKPLPKTIKEVVKDYIEQELDKVFTIDYTGEEMGYDEYYNGKQKFNPEYQDRYGISFDIQTIMEKYNLHKSYFEYFLPHADDIVSDIREKGFIVKIYPEYKNGYFKNAIIEIFWQDIEPLKSYMME